MPDARVCAPNRLEDLKEGLVARVKGGHGRHRHRGGAVIVGDRGDLAGWREHQRAPSLHANVDEKLGTVMAIVCNYIYTLNDLINPGGERSGTCFDL